MTTRAGTIYRMEDLQLAEERRGEEGGAEGSVQGASVGGRDQGGLDILAIC